MEPDKNRVVHLHYPQKGWYKCPDGMEWPMPPGFASKTMHDAYIEYREKFMGACVWIDNQEDIWKLATVKYVPGGQLLIPGSFVITDKKCIWIPAPKANTSVLRTEVYKDYTIIIERFEGFIATIRKPDGEIMEGLDSETEPVFTEIQETIDNAKETIDIDVEA